MTTSLNSILVATDFSLDGNNAVRRAARLARENGAGLHVVHVVQPSRWSALRGGFGPSADVELKSEQARRTLRRLAFEIAASHDVAASIEVRVGDVLPTLLQRAERSDLVVLGRRGEGRLKAFVGSTAERMRRACRRPLLFVKQAARGPYRRVLLPVDLTPASDAPLRHAALVARTACLHVLHATDDHAGSMLRRLDVDESVVRAVRAREQAAAHARLRRKVARLGFDGARLSLAVDRGPAVPAALRHAAAVGADLVVVGRQGGSGLRELLLGSVGGRLSTDCRCDVLIVPTPRESQEPRVVLPQAPLQGSWIGKTA